MRIKILIYGYGNPGRFDDGLGVRLAEEMEAWISKNKIDGVDCDTNYQLNIEDAEIISNYDLVLFADASEEDIRDVSITRVSPSDSKIEFTMHAVSPAFVLDLCNQIYGKTPSTWLIHIKGQDWQFNEGLSKMAKKNLSIAIKKTKAIILEPGNYFTPAKESEMKDGI
ncbi:MAG: hydrogenase maturation protease [Bacteroidota bacterium]|nr:hydrogenase maturation protease [Bacteroidota bacterium]